MSGKYPKYPARWPAMPETKDERRLFVAQVTQDLINGRKKAEEVRDLETRKVLIEGIEAMWWFLEQFIKQEGLS